MDVSKAKKDEIIERLNQFCPEHKDVKDGRYFYSIKTTWNEGLEEIKKAICDPKVKCVSFDIFDTLDKKTLNILYINLLIGFLTLAIQLIVTSFYMDIVPVAISILSFILLLSFLLPDSFVSV